MWQVGQWTSDQNHRSDGQADDMRQLRVLADGLHGAIVDIDHRLNEITGSRAEARRQLEAEISDLAQRTARLEAQLAVLSDRAQQQPLPLMLRARK